MWCHMMLASVFLPRMFEVSQDGAHEDSRGELGCTPLMCTSASCNPNTSFAFKPSKYRI